MNGSPLPYSLATLPPRSTHLQVEGKVPVVAILDSGACSIGKDFAEGIPRLKPYQLVPTPRVITACGTHATALGISKTLFQFCIAANTPNETTIMGRVVVMDTAQYDVLMC